MKENDVLFSRNRPGRYIILIILKLIAYFASRQYYKVVTALVSFREGGKSTKNYSPTAEQILCCDITGKVMQNRSNGERMISQR
jgi:hypothetical protein